MSLAALQDRVAGLKAKAADQAQTNRAKAPEFAAFVDDLRAHFGDGVKVRYVEFPDGTRIGKPGSPGVPASIVKSRARRGTHKDKQ